jgi:hypothetical protein
MAKKAHIFWGNVAFHVLLRYRVGTTTFILNVGNQRRIGEQQASRSEFVKYRCQTTGRGPFGELQHCFCFLQNFRDNSSLSQEVGKSGYVEVLAFKS